MSHEAHENSKDYTAPPRDARHLRITTSSPLDGRETTTEYLEHLLEPSIIKHQAYWHNLFMGESLNTQPSTARLVLFKDQRIMWARGAAAFEQNTWSELANERPCTAHLETQVVHALGGHHVLYAHVVTDIHHESGSHELLIPQSTYELIALVGATTNTADNLFLVVDGVDPEHHHNPNPKRLFAGNIEAYFTSPDRPRPLYGS